MWEKLAALVGNVFPSGKSLLGFRGTFSRVGKACRARGEHFPGWGKLARFPRDVFPGRKSLLGFRGTFSRVGKACSVSEGRFPEWEKLARFPRNVFPDRKSLLGFRGTFSRVGKTCCVLRQAFNDNILAAVISRSLTSGRMRYAPTVFGEKLIRNNAIHHSIPNE